MTDDFPIPVFITEIVPSGKIDKYSIYSPAPDAGFVSSVSMAGKLSGGVRHSRVMERIRKIFGNDAGRMESFYIAKSGASLRCYHLSIEQADTVISSFSSAVGHMPNGAREKVALDTIEQVLGVTLIRQYAVAGFRLDGYHKETNTAYEVDEEQHFINGKLKASCVRRQKIIERELKCKFVRIKV